ncbi:MAG: beta-1,6-N-acetylglucosaminyltransferase [Pseudomonadota bacterium]
MTLGVVMLVHTALGRAEQVARHWARAGCPVVIHVDRKVPRDTYGRFVAALSDQPEVQFSKRHRCEWGTWGIVAATQSASAHLMDRFPMVRHVLLSSGACLPLRPVRDLQAYLAARPRTDFIESATTADVPWTVGGLDEERFLYRFPFAWRRHRALFDTCTQVQRSLGLRRKIPAFLVPHMGSQWWCLTRRTLIAILQDPARKTYDRYFRKVWIPDESYFQTLVRLHSDTIESRSLTLSKFDHQGKPHIFYDDHLELLHQSDCFVARKIWPRADQIYDHFLAPRPGAARQQEPRPGKTDRVFAKAVARRVQGRAGLYMPSRFPREDRITAAPYSVFQGFAEVFENFESWLAGATGARVHGHLFAPDRAHFAQGQTTMTGALSDNPLLRDYDPEAFLQNLIWNTRGQRQCFQFGPEDNQAVNWPIAKDPNAQILVISGAWAVPLFRSTAAFPEVRQRAARLQKIERAHLSVLRSPQVKARIRVWTMAEFVEAPMTPLQAILKDIGTEPSRRLSEVPRMVDLSGFGAFLQNLRNQGMHPDLMGDFPVGPRQEPVVEPAPSRPYLVR